MAVAVFEQIIRDLEARATQARIERGVLVVPIGRKALLPTVELLRHRGFDLFLDVTAVDWPGREPRFGVVWHFYSTTHHARIRLKTAVTEDDPAVDTLTGLYGSARYMERECHEMYGIVFQGNPDLRALLLYEGFEGHPLRKDYPKQREQPLVPYRK